MGASPVRFSADSLGKPGFSQTAGEGGKVFIPAECRQVSQVRNAQPGIVFQRQVHAFPCWFKSSSERITRRIYACWQQENRIVTHGRFGSGSRHVVVT